MTTTLKLSAQQFHRKGLGPKMSNLPELLRELTPFEHQVLELMCDGLTNSAIAIRIHHSEKVIENTISRASTAFEFENRSETNIRVALALAYRTHFGDGAFDKLGYQCDHLMVDEYDRHICGLHSNHLMQLGGA
jgi:hypothetical protein